MSKFFKLAVSSSDSSDSEESDREINVPTAHKTIIRDFNYPSDSDDEGPKRVVRAQKDKFYTALKDQIRLGRNARNINDFSKLLNGFENLIRSFDKAKLIMARENLTIPRFYIRYLVELEDFLNEQWEDKEARKNMSKLNAKSFSALRQKIRKYNKDFEVDINAYREGPDPVGYSSGAASEDDEVIDEKPTAVAEKVVKKKEAVDTEDEWGDDSDSDSSDSDIDLEGKQMEELRRYFLKKEKTTTKKEKTDRAQKEKKEKAKKELTDDEDDEGWSKVTHKDSASKPLFDAKVEINSEVVINKLTEIIAQRGRKNTNRKVFVRHLQELYNIADEHNLGPGVLAKILVSVISSLFEMNSKITEAMDFSAWCKTLETIDGLLSLLIENDNVFISVKTTEEEENLSDASKPYRFHGSVVMQVKRLDDELTRIFQQSDCHSTEYIEKLKGEKLLCELVEKAQRYVDGRRETVGFDLNEVATIYMIRIEHIYYKFTEDPEAEKSLSELCKKIYALKDEKLQRQRALLCQIYHHALHDRWNSAKELLLMSHLQAIVDHTEASTQILYNRTMCQIGLCAFRHGFIREAHQALSEIHNTQRPKELLAQGVAPRQLERTAEQESRERSLQVPYHMHINLEVMECVYLICSMLLEIPSIASHEHDLRRRLLSRLFHYQLKFSERSALVGPPENTREHVVAASRAMLKGDWIKCRDFIINEKMNAKVWNLFRESEKVKTLVIERIQEESLRTYLLMFSTVYSTVYFQSLCLLFELSKEKVYSIVSKMIIQEELSATLDEPTDSIIMHRVEPSRLQLLALSLTDKLSLLADNNEQIIEPRGGRSGFTGSGGWSQRTGADRAGDDKRRTGGLFQGQRTTDGQRRGGWNQNVSGNRRRDVRVRF